jgi:biopolymer transport protein ExbD
MTEKRIKFRKEITLFDIPKTRFWTGIIIGLLYAIIIYSFLYLSREAIRIGFVLSYNYDVWVLSDEEVNFYNFFFASVSMLFGHAICFNFWIHYPKKFGEKNKKYFKKFSILNDIWGLNTAHFMYITKLGSLYGVWFGCTLGFYVFSLYPKIKYLLIAIIIVVFLDQWKALRLMYPKKSLKWMGTSMIVIVSLSFGFSRINVINYKKINEGYLKNSLEYNYALTIPTSNYSQRNENISLIRDLYFVYPKNQLDTSKMPTIIFENNKIKFAELSLVIESVKAEYGYEFNRPPFYFQLHIDKDIPYKYIKKLKDELSKNGLSRIIYRTISKKNNFPQKYSMKFGIPFILPPNKLLPTPPPYLIENVKKENCIAIALSSSYILFENSKIPYNGLKQRIINKISEDNKRVFYLIVDNKCSYNQYIQVIDQFFTAIYYLRDNLSQEKYGKPYNKLNYNESDSIRIIYPINIFEE